METKPPAIQELQNKANEGDEKALEPLARALDEAGRPGEATEILSIAANRGSFEARYLVGSRLLMGAGAPLLPQDGIRLISESVQRSAGAAHLLGVLALLGAYVPQDFGQALRLLQLAAELGSVDAREQLALLSGDAATAASQTLLRSSVWGELRAKIDIQEWLAPPVSEPLSVSPRIVRFEKLLPPRVCEWLINRVSKRLKRAQIYSGAAPSVDNYRSNSAAEFNLTQSDFITAFTQVRIARAAGVALNQLEALSVLHYAVGEQFADHYDFVDPRSPDAARDIAHFGQRIITFLIYLNDGYAGGDTAFPRLGITHKGTVGDALLFCNVAADGSPDLRTLHSGRPPTSGEKWVATQFVRSRQVIPGTSRPHAG